MKQVLDVVITIAGVEISDDGTPYAVTIVMRGEVESTLTYAKNAFEEGRVDQLTWVSPLEQMKQEG